MKPYLLGGWIAFVLLLSMLPLSLKTELGTTGPLHNLGHVLIFAVTTALLCWDLRSWGGRVTRCAVVLSLAFLLEGMERLVYLNHFEWKDIRSDVTGLILGLTFAISASGLGWSKRRRSEPEG